MLKKTLIIVLLGFTLLSSTLPVFAADEPALDQTPTTNTTVEKESIPLIVPLPGATKTSSITDYVRTIFLYGIGLAALLAMAQLAFGAVQYTASAGFPALQEASKSRIQSALIGLILLIGAITILGMFNREGTRNFDNIALIPKTVVSQRTKEDALYRKNQTYQDRYQGTLHEMRKTWDNYYKRNPGDDPGDAILISKLVETLEAIEDNPAYNLANDPAARAGYLAARRDIFRREAIPSVGGAIYKGAGGLAKTPALFPAYEKSRTQPKWATILPLDRP